MNREQQEMAPWREAYTLAISQGANYGQADKAATTAAESFRQRYPAEPAADDRLGRAAIKAMDAIMGAMREEHEDAKLLTLVERAAQNYMAARWHIQKEGGK